MEMTSEWATWNEQAQVQTQVMQTKKRMRKEEMRVRTMMQTACES
jgi:hypothetical protein